MWDGTHTSTERWSVSQEVEVEQVRSASSSEEAEGAQALSTVLRDIRVRVGRGDWWRRAVGITKDSGPSEWDVARAPFGAALVETVRGVCLGDGQQWTYLAAIDNTLDLAVST